MNFLNKIDCKDLSVIVMLTFFTGIWCFHNCIIRSKYNTDAGLKKCTIEIPASMRFLFPSIVKGKLLQEKCLNMWALGHSLTYFITGLIIPNRYQIVIILSILCEIYEYFVGYQSKLSDIFVNTFSYFIGSQFTIKYLQGYDKIICKHKNLFYISIPLCILFLYLIYIYKEDAWD